MSKTLDRSDGSVHRSLSMGRGELAWLGGIMLLALILRLIWAAIASADPTDGRFDDSAFYHLIAVSMSHGHGYDSPYTFLPTAEWPPGYPFFLTGLYWVFGSSTQVAEIANALLGTATVGLVFLLGLRLFDRTAARLSALFLAVMPGQILFIPLVYSETLFTFLFVAGLLITTFAADAKSGSRWRWLIALGLVSGAAALVRDAGLALPVIALAYWGLSGLGWVRSLRACAITLAAAGLLILPWTARNYVVLHAPVLISSSSGISLWQGHHEGGNGGFDWPGSVELSREYGPRDRPGGEIDISQAALRKGLHFIATHPAQEPHLAYLKLRILFEGDTVGLNLADRFGAQPFLDPTARRAVSGLAGAAFFATIGLAGLALLRAWQQRRVASLLPAIAVLVLTLGVVTFSAEPRYHFPMVPAFCLLAGWGAAWILELVAHLGWRQRAPDAIPA